MKKQHIIILVIICVILLFILNSDKKKMKYPLKTNIRITSKYGNRIHPITKKSSFHNGVDIAAPTGTPIYAPLSGKISAVYKDDVGGNQMTVVHPGGWKTGYAHLQKSLFTSGTAVTEGQVIGYTGNTGSSTAPHLHLTLRKDGKILNPEEYFTV